MMRYTGLLAVCASFMGCVHADGPYNKPSQEKLRLESKTPQAYTVQVANKNVPVGADGRVVVDVPRLQRGHTTYLFGVAKVSESSPEGVAAVSLKKDGRTIRKLSLNDLKELPADSEGYRLFESGVAGFEACASSPRLLRRFHKRLRPRHRFEPRFALVHRLLKFRRTANLH